MRADTEQIDELIDSLPRQPYGTGSRREDCRELVREVRKQDDALIRQLVEAMEGVKALNMGGELALWTAEFDRLLSAIAAARARLGGQHGTE